jgi:hypothetical protein
LEHAVELDTYGSLDLRFEREQRRGPRYAGRFKGVPSAMPGVRCRRSPATLIKKHARLAAERIIKLKKPTVEQIGETIAVEFEASAI